MALRRLLGSIEKDGWKKSLWRMHIFNEVRTGTLKGTDSFGNQYYESGKDSMQTRSRWVEQAVNHKQEVNAAKVPPEWHNWLHHIVDTVPEEDPRHKPLYAKEHVTTELSKMGYHANYMPPGALKAGKHEHNTHVKKIRYEPWTPAQK